MPKDIVLAKEVGECIDIVYLEVKGVVIESRSFMHPKSKNKYLKIKVDENKYIESLKELMYQIKDEYDDFDPFEYIKSKT